VDLQLSVLVRIDPEQRCVRLVTTGHLTETNQRALYPLIRRARALTADTEVVVDLTAIHHLEDAALDLLCWEIEHDDTGCPDRPVRLALTRPSAAGRPSSSPAGEAARAGSVTRTGSTAWASPGTTPAVSGRSSPRNGPGRRLLAPRARPAEGRPPMTTAAVRPRRHSPVETAALSYGAVFLLVGLAGFIPGLTTGYHSLESAGHHSEAMLLGVFRVSVPHNLVHLFYGIAGAGLMRTARGARHYLRWGGVVYLALWLHGALVGEHSPVNVVPLNTADDWLHLLLGATMVGLSFLRQDAAPRSPTGPAR